MDILVGHTGFVGHNISKNHKFNNLCNSKNINEAFNKNPDLLVYAGVRAEKFLANKNPNEDFLIIENAIENIKKINPKKLVLISTIDVYKNPIGVDEDTPIDLNGLSPYGLNRYYLENWIEKNIENYTIVRLPALYGENIKKNFIYDLINIIPSILNETKFNEINSIDGFIFDYYVNQNNGFYKCKQLRVEEKTLLRKYFDNICFNALNFTDSRGIFQFYNLQYLWKHIEIALKNTIKKINIATEPIIISELYKCIKRTEFINEINDYIPKYNFKTKHLKTFNAKNGYIFDKDFIIKDIKLFTQIISK